jgi:Uma2 family endonuclease
MAIATTRQYPLVGKHAGFRRFTVDEYHKLIQMGMLTENDDLELLDGYLVHKMPHDPHHDGTILCLEELIRPLLPVDWVVRGQSSITLSRSEPEPDVSVVRGTRRSYFTRHPMQQDFGIVVEVANSSLDTDQIDKQRIYARDGLPIYWIVNLPNRRVEVYTDPQPAADPPSYATRTDYPEGSSVPFVLDGATVGMIAVDEILP